MPMEPDSAQLREGSLKIRMCFMLIVAVIFTGTAGYRVIERWDWIDCLYMTITTLSTVGYSEIHQLSTLGRIFTMALIIGGVGTLAFGLTGLIGVIFQHQMMMLSTKYKTRRMIAKMEDHIIICGGGKMGMAVLNRLRQEGIKDIIIIENDPVRVLAIEENKIPVVHGDAKEEHSLNKAAIARAKALVATLDNDADNLFLVLTARGMNQHLNIIARAETEANRRKFIQAGASQTVSPFLAGAKTISSLLVSPDITALAEVIESDDNIKFNVEKLDIRKDDRFDGKTISQANLREVLGGLVVAIKKSSGKTVFNPHSNTGLNDGDVLYIIKFSERHNNNG